MGRAYRLRFSAAAIGLSAALWAGGSAPAADDERIPPAVGPSYVPANPIAEGENDGRRRQGPAPKPAMRAVTGPTAMILLLATPIVRNELAFTPEQLKTLDTLANRQTAWYRNVPPYDPEMAEARQREIEKYGVEMFLAIEQLLTPVQKARFDELLLQVYSAYAFFPLGGIGMSEYLGFSDEQLKRIDRICRESVDTTCNMYYGGDQRDYLSWTQARENERLAIAKLLTVMTAEQRERLKGLQGVPTDLSKLREEHWAACVVHIRATRVCQDPKPLDWPRDLATGRKMNMNPDPPVDGRLLRATYTLPK